MKEHGIAQTLDTAKDAVELTDSMRRDFEGKGQDVAATPKRDAEDSVAVCEVGWLYFIMLAKIFRSCPFQACISTHAYTTCAGASAEACAERQPQGLL